MLKKAILSVVTSACLLSLSGCAALAWGKTEVAARSNLIGMDLPTGAVRLSEATVPNEVNVALQRLIAAGKGKLTQGQSLFCA